VLNEDKTRVHHHRLERNGELRMGKSAKEMLHIQRKRPQTLNNGMDKHPNLFFMVLMKYSTYHIKVRLPKHFRSTTTILSYQKLSGCTYQR
jgi:hypothetical protein